MENAPVMFWDTLPSSIQQICALIRPAIETTHSFSYRVAAGLWDIFDGKSAERWGSLAISKAVKDDLSGALFYLDKCVAIEAKQDRIKVKRFEIARDAVKKEICQRAATVIYLAVPYKDKDQAKALGAKFDGELRKWFIPPGKSPAPFAQWLSCSSHEKKGQEVE